MPTACVQRALDWVTPRGTTHTHVPPEVETVCSSCAYSRAQILHLTQASHACCSARERTGGARRGRQCAEAAYVISVGAGAGARIALVIARS